MDGIGGVWRWDADVNYSSIENGEIRTAKTMILMTRLSKLVPILTLIMIGAAMGVIREAAKDPTTATTMTAEMGAAVRWMAATRMTVQYIIMAENPDNDTPKPSASGQDHYY